MIVGNYSTILQIRKIVRKTSKGVKKMSMTYQETEHELERAQAGREELVERMSRLISEDGAFEVQKDVYLSRSSFPTECVHRVFSPAFCIIAQGSKEVMLGEDRYKYDPWHYLLGSVELPVASQ